MPSVVVEFPVEELAAAIAELIPSPSAEPEFRLWNLEEAAAAFGRSTRWVRDRVKAGDLPYVRLDGGAYAFLPEDVRAFAVERRVAA